jgi:hypothetical protein
MALGLGHQVMTTADFAIVDVTGSQRHHAPAIKALWWIAFVPLTEQESKVEQAT